MPRSRLPSTRALALLAVATGGPVLLLVGGQQLAPVVSIALIVATTTATLLLVRWERAGARIPVTLAVAAIAVVLTLAVVEPPQTSHDLWSYTMYGRIVAVHDSSPWTHVPADFPHDPMLSRVGRGWRHTPAVYGPVFVAQAAGFAAIAGDSPLANRLLYQGTAALTIALALVLIWRRTRSPAALLLLGLQPAIVLTAINGGHNDVLVGCMLLGAALLAGRRRLALAGALVGFAVLIKITAGLAVFGLVLWLLHRRDWRAAVRVGAPAAAVAVTGYLIVGGAALTALAANTSTTSRASVWQIPERLLGLEGPGGAFGLRHHDLIGMVTTVGSIGVVLLAGVLAWRVARRPDPAESMAVATMAYPFVAVYTLPWYSAWALPTCALHPRSRVTTLAVLQAGFLAAAYSLPRGLPAVAFVPNDRPLVEFWLPALLLVGLLVAVFTKDRRLGSPPRAIASV